MRKSLKQLFATLLCLCGCVPTNKPPATPPVRWAAYYNTELPASAFSELDLVVFDDLHYPDFKTLKGTTLVLSYISIGEVHGTRPEKELVGKKGDILYKNEKWNSYAVDLKSVLWRRLVLGAVDKAVSKGFDGVMLDTVDSPLEWARQKNDETYQAMQEAAIALIHDIHKKYPDIKIMLNRGFVIQPAVVADIDYILAESILTYKDEFTGQYDTVSPKAYSDAVRQLHALISRTDKQLKIVTLDYWDMSDANGMEKIYAKQRAAGFIPYVTTPDLQHYTPENTQSSVTGHL